ALGLGLPANDDRATYWFRKAAEAGDAWAGDINKLLSADDPHAAYLSQAEYREMLVQTRGDFGGLGIEIGLIDGRPKVIAPLDDTPAAKAGLRAGDMFLRVDDAPT